MSVVEDTGQQFCLKWNNYQASLSSTFSDLLSNDSFVDVTLSCGGEKTVKAHRLLLSACSSYFREILSGLSFWQHPVIVLRDVKYQDLLGIVEFIYHGEVSIDQTCLPGFLAAAESLRIKGLTGDSKIGEGISGLSSVHNSSTEQESTDRDQINTTQSSEADKLINEPVDDETISNNNSSEDILVEEDEEEMVSEEEVNEKGLQLQTLYNNFMSTQVKQDEIEGDNEHSLGIGFDTAGFSLDPSSVGLGENGGKKTCPFCLQQLSWHALSRHIRDMHRAKTDLVTCQYCRKTFRNKNSLGCHIWRFHKRGKELIGSGKNGHPTGHTLGTN